MTPDEINGDRDWIKIPIYFDKEKNEYINDYICFNELYITDLQHAIYELRKEGYLISDSWIYLPNKKKYKNYRLGE